MIIKCIFKFINFQSGANGTTTIPSEGSDFSEEQDSPKIIHKPFFRRLSFKALRKGKVKIQLVSIKWWNEIQILYCLYFRLHKHTFVHSLMRLGSISDNFPEAAFRRSGCVGFGAEQEEISQNCCRMPQGGQR